jgi:anti-sigma B factor antagonist
MNLKVSDHKDIKIVYLSGRLDAMLSGEVEAELEKLIEAGACKMILELQQLECLSSSGIRIFIAISRKLITKKGKLVFCQMPPQIRKIIKAVELEDVFEIHDTLYEAFNAFDA